MAEKAAPLLDKEQELAYNAPNLTANPRDSLQEPGSPEYLDALSRRSTPKDERSGSNPESAAEQPSSEKDLQSKPEVALAQSADQAGGESSGSAAAANDGAKDFAGRWHEAFKLQTIFLILGLTVTYSIAHLIVVHIQEGCGYRSPTLIVCLNQVFLGCVAWMAFFLVLPILSDKYSTKTDRKKCKDMFMEQFHAREEPRSNAPGDVYYRNWHVILSILYWLLQAVFILATRLTWVHTVLIIEQIAPLFVALLSGPILESPEYTAMQWFLLSMASVGAVLNVLGEKHGSIPHRSDPFVGNVLALAVALGAAAYMVLFRYAFGKKSFTIESFTFFIAIRATIAVFIGWIFMVVYYCTGVDMPNLPSGEAVLWMMLGAVFSGLYTVLLALVILVLNPLTARLSVMLAMPFIFFWDLFIHGHFSFLRLIGGVLVFVGVLLYEYRHRIGYRIATESPQNSRSHGNSDDGDWLKWEADRAPASASKHA